MTPSPKPCSKSSNRIRKWSPLYHFTSLEQLKLEWNDYVHWFNHIRIHGTLGYLTLVEFKRQALSSLVLTFQE
ncbi:IS3 family transposase [Niallia taxi]|uniref:IS3 family transposase n=1 Tax=Niallia taxi TaxID=2499688 RepID=UPI003D2A6E91